VRIVTNSEQVERYLSPHHKIYVVTSEQIASDWYDPDQFDLIVVDIDSAQGVFTPRAIAQVNSGIPIIGVSEDLPFEGEWPEQRAIFIEQGGSYLLQAPVNPREMLACISAATRRLRSTVHTIKLYDKRLVIRTEEMTVLFDGKIIGFTGHETKLMLILARNYGGIVSRSNIAKLLYPTNSDEQESNTIEVFVTRIRTKLNDLHPGLGSCIVTRKGLGYQLIDITT
jgi:DNA-binding response OmpR family regulator